MMTRRDYIQSFGRRYEDVMLGPSEEDQRRAEGIREEIIAEGIERKGRLRDMRFNNQSLPMALNNKNRRKGKQKSGE